MPDPVELNVNNEYNKKYAESVVRIKDKKSGEYVYRNIGGFVENITGTITNPKGEVQLGKPKVWGGKAKWYYQSDRIENYVWGENVYPYRLGIINIKPHIFFIRRVPQRQWQRGASLRNTIVSLPTLSLLQRFVGMKKLSPTSCDIAQAMINWSGYPSFQQALYDIKNKKVYSRAFCDRFWLSVSGIHPDIVLGYKMWPVGRISGSKVILPAAASPLREDLSQFTMVEVE